MPHVCVCVQDDKASVDRAYSEVAGSMASSGALADFATTVRAYIRMCMHAGVYVCAPPRPRAITSP
jgi:hypothetical protein